ncbi:MAG: MerR family DNA-binding protein [Gemmatimonadetes bacterium]|nr:MerR family DNA-binding protein [Gemmatimonadota bacterium]MDA1103424.1 MerR family DNA-binding protein [Gemmatimonadota bacterium]
MSHDETLTIGALAGAADVGRETIRFYENKGLIDAPPRSPAGYRRYPQESVQRLRFIRRAQELGFTLSEVAELLALRVDEVSACGPVEVRAREKLEQVDAKIVDLKRIGASLRRLVDKCEARQPTSDCPILEELDERS